MDKTKIPWIDCVVTLPEQVEENFKKLITIYKKNSRSKKKLKKKISRITTSELQKNEIIATTDENILTQLKSHMLIQQNFSVKLENKIINYIDNIIKKYMNIYIHKDDKTLLLSEKNKDADKLFLKFYFPRIINNGENDVLIENKINKFGDNIHFTLLPDIFGHGSDGMFHLTFRIESKTGKPIYEYSKYISFNIVDEKVAIVLYDDEKGNNSVVFRISENIQNLYNFIDSMMKMSTDDFEIFMENKTINTQVYKDICTYIALDIFQKLFKTKKIDNFFKRYLNSFGLHTVYKMINKLLSILLSTFLDLHSYSNKS